ncbi:sulfotransferase [Elusimicrobiota bacterium]
MHSDKKFVFIGGTGRCGTTIFAKTLGMMSSLYTWPVETRFITDPDGLLGLKSGLVDNWSPYQANMSVSRFQKLMKSLKYRFLGNYPNIGLKRSVGSSYDEIVAEYVTGLQSYGYRAIWTGNSNMAMSILSRLIKNKKLFKAVFARDNFFSVPLDTETFNKKTGEFTEKLLYAPVSSKKGIKAVIDHTPYSILYCDFIKEMLPESKFIHIYRDPRDVAASFIQNKWGPENIEKAAQWVRSIYERWENKKTKLETGDYIEIKFEDFIEKPEYILEKTCEFIGVSYEKKKIGPDLTKANIGRWKNQLSRNELKIIEKYLGNYVEKYQYEK